MSARFTLPPRARPRAGRRLFLSVGIAVLVFGGVMVLFERSMIYYPTRYPDGFWDTAAVSRAGNATVEDRWFDAEDGVRLHGWSWSPAGGDAASPVVLFFHGNAGNLSHRAPMVQQLGAVGLSGLVIDYRGYGRSEGRPSERGLYRDALAAWRQLVETNGVEPRRVVLLGESLGGAVAVDLAARVDPAGLVLLSAFTSVPDMARHHFPFIPTVLVRTRMDSLSKVGAVGCPVLVIHSTADEIVPFSHARRLYERAAGPKRQYTVEGAGHNDTWSVGGTRLLAEIERFAREATAASRPLEGGGKR